MKGIWFEVGVLYCWGERGDYIGLVWNLGGWLGGVLGGIGGAVIGLGLDRGVWFYCVCWDEVDNALRKGRGLPKNVNRGDVYKYKKVNVILCFFITLTSTDKQKIIVDIKSLFYTVLK